MSTPSRASTAAVPLHSRWPRWLRRGPMEIVACVLIGAGVLMLLQPFVIELFTYSFIVTLAGTALFMVVSKFPD
jgi:hypothetical protein